ncbi:MAG: hypothetical protein AAF741_01915 [Bacteroidota bacterium]
MERIQILSFLLAVSFTLICAKSGLQAQISIQPYAGYETLIISESSAPSSSLDFNIENKPFADQSIVMGIKISKQLSKQVDIFFGMSYASYKMSGDYLFGVAGNIDQTGFRNYNLNLGLIYNLSNNINLGVGPNITFVRDHFWRRAFSRESIVYKRPGLENTLIGLGTRLSYQPSKFSFFFNTNLGLFYLDRDLYDKYINAFSTISVGVAYDFKL